MQKKINICGIPFKIKEVPVIEEADEGITQGQIIYSQAKIFIKKDLPKRLKRVVLFHEALHGMLVQLGYNNLSCDETFVQSLSNAMSQMFEFKDNEKRK